MYRTWYKVFAYTRYQVLDLFCSSVVCSMPCSGTMIIMQTATNACGEVRADVSVVRVSPVFLPVDIKLAQQHCHPVSVAIPQPVYLKGIPTLERNGCMSS